MSMQCGSASSELAANSLAVKYVSFKDKFEEKILWRKIIPGAIKSLDNLIKDERDVKSGITPMALAILQTNNEKVGINVTDFKHENGEYVPFI